MMTADEYERVFREKFDPSKFSPEEIEPGQPFEPQDPNEPIEPQEPDRPIEPKEPQKPDKKCSIRDRRSGRCP